MKPTGRAPNIPRVQIKIVTDNSTRQAELMSGEVDLAYNAQSILDGPGSKPAS